jgi:predicted  nucleic acid-binding Zn-ribbon protein
MAYQSLPTEQAEKLAMRHRLDAELVALQSDKKRLERGHNDIMTEVKRLKNDLSRLEIAIQEKELSSKKISSELFLVDGDIAKIRKKINMI